MNVNLDIIIYNLVDIRTSKMVIMPIMIIIMIIGSAGLQTYRTIVLTNAAAAAATTAPAMLPNSKHKQS